MFDTGSHYYKGLAFLELAQRSSDPSKRYELLKSAQEAFKLVVGNDPRSLYASRAELNLATVFHLFALERPNDYMSATFPFYLLFSCSITRLHTLM